ncbi:hypothetical protein GCM10009093_12230 [Brevundimonas terrae]|uniref:Uncharacterized protein n=1 Tax=Brevundimonas terrae TaxID=363631 RepID=A0ABP3I238_9CAUL
MKSDKQVSSVNAGKRHMRITRMSLRMGGRQFEPGTKALNSCYEIIPQLSDVSAFNLPTLPQDIDRFCEAYTERRR